MMKKIALIIAMVSLASLAGVEEPFVQFTREDYHSEQRPGDLNASENTTQSGGWHPAQLISLSVQAGTNVWLTHKVESWYTDTDLDGVEFDMLGGSERYGYIFKDAFNGDLTMEKGTYDDLIHWASGDTDMVTYTNDSGPQKSTRTGYFLDHFDDDTEIYLVMTTLATDTNPQEAVDSYQYVQSANHVETTLMSRRYDYDDNAGNVVINFGIDNGTYGDGNGIGREFVAVYDQGPNPFKPSGGTTGGPLPCGAIAWIIGLGTVSLARKMKKA